MSIYTDALQKAEILNRVLNISCPYLFYLVGDLRLSRTYEMYCLSYVHLWQKASRRLTVRSTSMSWGPFLEVYLHSTWNVPTVKPMHLTAATLSWHSSRCWWFGRMLGQFDPARQ